MYQVLTHSTPISLAEYNANLTKADVNKIMANLNAAAPNHRISAGNLDQAQLNPQGSAKDGASLTLDNNPTPNLWANPMLANPMLANPMLANPLMNPLANPFAANPFSAIPGQTAPLVQQPETPVEAQPGRFQALVQHGVPQGEGGEMGEAAEASEAKNRSANKTTNHNTDTAGKHPGAVEHTATHPGNLHTDHNHTGHGQPIRQSTQRPNFNRNTGPSRLRATANPHPANTTSSHHKSALSPTQAPTQHLAAAHPVPNQQQPVMTKEQDITGKDSNKGMSKDQRTRTENAQNMNTNPPLNTPAVTGTGTSSNIKPGQHASQGQPGVVHTGTPGHTLTGNTDHTQAGTPGGNINQASGNPPGNSDSIPIGIKEAGLVPDLMNDKVPVKADTGYSSTGFAIAAGVIIALIVILGPVACMLWKMKEKHAEKLRKQKAYKNRDMSENNIMESMVLHDFGKGSSVNSVTNKAAEGRDYFGYGKGVYSTINADIGEIERFSGNPELPHGRLP